METGRRMTVSPWAWASPGGSSSSPAPRATTSIGVALLNLTVHPRWDPEIELPDQLPTSAHPNTFGCASLEPVCHPCPSGPRVALVHGIKNNLNFELNIS